MTPGEFANYAVGHGCEILQSGTAPVIRLRNPETGEKFNVDPSRKWIPAHVARLGCIRLGIPLIEVEEEN